jgi:hypothetical protein
VTQPGLAARRQLAALIKQARYEHVVNGRPMTQAALGIAIGCSQGKIQKMESGTTEISATDLDQIIDTLAVQPRTAATMRDLVQASRLIDPWSGERVHVPTYARWMIDAEKDAVEVLCWHEARIPGPLQSDHYMLTLFGSGRKGEIDVTPHYRNRKQRREVLRGPQLRRYSCVLGEESLRRARASLGRGPALDQIDFLLRLAEPNSTSDVADERTTISLLPLDADVPYVPNDFSLIRLPESGHSFVYVESVCGADYHRGEEALTKAQNAWHELHQAALDTEGTLAALRKLRQDFAER